jgi:ribonuclease P protein component
MLTYVLPGDGPVRSGFVSSRRIGGAVVRNRARRQMKEAWRSVSSSIDGSYDVVFTARPEIREARTQDLIEEMHRSLADAGVTLR